jgi:hypothetical protein
VAYPARGTATNLVHVRVPADGRVCVSSTIPAHVLVDLQGVYQTGGTGAWLQLALPGRVLDTRTGTGGWTGPVTGDDTITTPSTVPPHAVAALATVTTMTPAAAGTATLGPQDIPLPAIGGLAYPRSTTTATPTLARLDTSGNFALRASGRALVAVDVVAWFAPVPVSSVPPPSVSTSHYVSNNSGDPTADRAAARTLGCAQAKRESSGLVVLAFGSQRATGTKKYNDATRVLSYDDIRATARGWVEGLAGCAAPGAAFTVALTTNNFGGITDWNGADGGTRWAQLVEQVAADTAGQSTATVAGGNDLEPGWGPPAQARAWLDAYLAATQRPLYDTGSADNCPAQWSPEKPCANGWSMGDVFYVATGASPRVLAVPEVYTPNGFLASQWARLSRWGVDHGLGQLRIGAVLTEQGACQQVGGCTGIDLAPNDAWAQLWGALDADPLTATTPVGSLTDIAWIQP